MYTHTFVHQYDIYPTKQIKHYYAKTNIFKGRNVYSKCKLPFKTNINYAHRYTFKFIFSFSLQFRFYINVYNRFHI